MSETFGDPISKTITYWDPVETAAKVTTMSGLEALQAIVDGVLPPAPIATLMGYTAGEVSAGYVKFTCTPDMSVYNPIGMVHGGLVCTLLDTVTACAIHTTLAAGVGYTSIDLQVQYLRPVFAGNPIEAIGRVTKTGRRVGFASGEVIDAEGRVLATATTTCLIMGG